ncbi:MAG TPA: glucosaminidase domain-containing protein, partial [Bacteroidales bacterium]|nr:glucosaminidase domain-containing protein [Bacteroidales bacterium]
MFWFFPLVFFAQERLSSEDYIIRYNAIAVKKMQEFKIPASITLAQGLLESGSGNSTLAREANNHFGIKCHKEWTGKTFHMDDDEKNECFRAYKHAEESFDDHSRFLTERSRYAFLF